MSSTIGIDSSILAGWYSAKSSASLKTAANPLLGATTKTAPTAPWNSITEPTAVSALTTSVLNGGKFVDPSAAKLDAPPTAASSSDYKNLFALYQGLSALQGVAQKASAAGLTASQTAAFQSRFTAGLTEVQGFLAGKPFQSLAIADAGSASQVQSTVGTPGDVATYKGAMAVTGSANAVPADLAPDARFSVTVTREKGTPKTVDFDLSALGDKPRSLANIVSYMNDQLSAAGVSSRVAVQKTVGTAQTTTAGGKTVDLGITSPDQYSLNINGSSLETLSFSAPAAQPAVYLSQTSGLTTGKSPDAVQQLLKFDPSQGAGASDKVFSQTLPSGLGTVRATATGPDGSVYMLADVTGATPDGQTLKGSQDVALVRYDSAGQLGYVRTLGAADSASGFALAVSADGKQVAVAGTVTGDLDAGDAIDDATSNSFVQVFSSGGDALWDTRSAAMGEQPQSIAFAADGSVVVTGSTHADLGVASAEGVYLHSYSATRHTAFDGSDLGYSVRTTSAANLAASGSQPAGVVALPDGRIAVASTQHGHAVVSLYASPLTANAQPTATRDLGDLAGGAVGGLALDDDGSLVIAGTSGSGSVDVGGTTSPYAGGRQAFVARIDAGLQPSSDDRLTYLPAQGGATTVTGVAVSGGQVYLAGQVTGAPVADADAASSSKDTAPDPSHTAFLTAVDPETGVVSWNEQVKGADGQAAPSGIAVDPRGASVLDALGLPNGAVSFASSDLVTSGTSARAGDSFTVVTGNGASSKVTLDADDTLDDLAAKINRASAYTAVAKVITVNGRSQLQVKPAGQTAVTLQSGPEGSDLLGAVGLPAGVVQTASAIKSKTNSVSSTPYALRLGVDLDISTTANAKAAQSTLAAALATVKQAYTDLITPPSTTKSATASASSGTVSAYTQGRIADYQLALSRLTG